MTPRTTQRDDARHLWDKTPLFLFLMITVAFFITSHNFFHNRDAVSRGVDFNPTEEEALELLAQYEVGSTYKAITYVALGVLSFIGILAFGRFIPLALRGLYGRVAIFFFMWCILSATWSFQPDLTMRKLAIFVMLSIAAVFTAQRFRMQDFLYFVVFSSGVYLAIGVGAELWWGSFRPWVDGYRFSGTVHPNGQGMNCALLVLSSLFACVYSQRLRKSLALLALIAFVFLLMTKSRTSFGVVLASLAVYALLWTPASFKLFFALFLGVVICTITVFYPVLGPLTEAIFQMGRLASTMDNAGNLSGRSDLWRECFHYIGQSPLLGWGYNSFWTLENTQEIQRQIDWYSGSAHSVYVDLWLGVGLIGAMAYLILILGGLLYFAREAVRTEDFAYGFAFVFLVFAALHSAFESAFLYPALYTFLLMTMFARRAFIEEHDYEDAPAASPHSEAAFASAH